MDLYNNYIRFNVQSSHFSCDLLYVLLTPHINPCDPRQIYNGEIRAVVGVDEQLDWVIHYLTSLTCHLVRQLLNVTTNIPKIKVLFSCCVILKDCVGLTIRFA